jgi:hypothetical protein
MSKFKKGNIPWNKDLKGIHLSPKSEFKKGERSGEKNNTWKGGVQTPVNDCVHLYDGVGKRKRRPRVIYEEHHGKLPNNYVIFHKNGNKYDDKIENLIAITRAELLKINTFRKNGFNVKFIDGNTIFYKPNPLFDE